jgi:hypothetical protein
VSRHFRQLIQNSPLLQYHLELSISGQIETRLCPPLSISILHHRLKCLRAAYARAQFKHSHSFLPPPIPQGHLRAFVALGTSALCLESRVVGADHKVVFWDFAKPTVTKHQWVSPYVADLFKHRRTAPDETQDAIAVYLGITGYDGSNIKNHDISSSHIVVADSASGSSFQSGRACVMKDHPEI